MARAHARTVIRFASIAVVVLAARVATAQAKPPTWHYAMSRGVLQVLVLADGSAVAIASDGKAAMRLLRECHRDSDVRVDLDQWCVRGIDVPDIGSGITGIVRGDELWLVGSRALVRATFVADRHEHGAWQRFDLDIADASSVTIASTGDGATVIVVANGVSHVLRFDAAMQLVQRSTLALELVGAVADGAGGVWSAVAAPDELRGYAHLRSDAWTLWTTQPPDGVDGFAAIERSAVPPPRVPRVVADGRGGIYAFTGAGLVHVAADGSADAVDDAAKGAWHGCSAIDPASGDLVYSPRVRRDRLVRLASDGTTTDVPLARSAAGYDRCVVGVHADTIWIVLRPGELAVRARDTWTIYAQAPEQHAPYHRVHDDDPGHRASYELAGGFLAAGVLVASGMHRESPLVVGGQLLGANGALGLGAAVAAIVRWDGWDGDHATREPSETAKIISAATLPIYAPVGAWAVGELAHPSQHPWRALGGAFVGEAVGVGAGWLISKALKRAYGRRAPNLASVMIGCVGSGIVIGYQALGGGPR
jgi:hypothetical protein